MLSTKELLKEINSDVIDILNLGYEISSVQSDYVPNHEDAGLTFGIGSTKKAKKIETCVLYADIRNSTSLSNTYSNEIMAKLYSAFVKSTLDAAIYHGGVVRNIIGDRVMVVFPAKDCYTKAIDTAISINTIATRIINKHFKGFEFKVGIGIDHGEMRVIKAGIPKQDPERSNYKNLVWIGKPANIASKLTDVANKDIKRQVYRVIRHPWNPKHPSSPLAYLLDITNPPSNLEKLNRYLNEPEYSSYTETVDLTPEQFAATIFQSSSANKEISTSGGKMVSFERLEVSDKTPAILMTERVFTEFAKTNPNRVCVLKKFWTEQKIEINDYSGRAFGGDVYWLAMDEI